MDMPYSLLPNYVYNVESKVSEIDIMFLIKAQRSMVITGLNNSFKKIAFYSIVF